MDKMFNCLQYSILNSTGITLKRDLKQYVDEGHWRRDLWVHQPYGCYVRVSRIKRLGRKMWSLDNKNIDKCGLLIRRPVCDRAGWRGAACHANRWTRSQSSSLCGWRRSWVKTLLSEKGTAISSPPALNPDGLKSFVLGKEPGISQGGRRKEHAPHKAEDVQRLTLCTAKFQEFGETG